VAGLVMAVLGHLPAVGDKIGASGWVFEVLALEGRRVEKVQARRSDLEFSNEGDALGH
jgi:putative hemolysin